MIYEISSIWKCLKADPACKPLFRFVAFGVCHKVALMIESAVTQGAFVLAQVYVWMLYQLRPGIVHFPTDSTLKPLFFCMFWLLILQIFPV